MPEISAKGVCVYSDECQCLGIVTERWVWNGFFGTRGCSAYESSSCLVCCCWDEGARGDAFASSTDKGRVRWWSLKHYRRRLNKETWLNRLGDVLLVSEQACEKSRTRDANR